MMTTLTFFEFKKLVGRMFRKRITEDNGDDIRVGLQNSFYLRGEPERIDFVIQDASLRQLYERVCSMASNGMELYDGNSYEIAVEVDYPLRRKLMQGPVSSRDDVNGVRYALGLPSLEYCAFLLMAIGEAKKGADGRSYYLPAMMPRFAESLRSDAERAPRDMASLLPAMMRAYTLRIETTDQKQLERFRRYKTSYLFHFMYQTGIALVDQTDIAVLYRNDVSGRSHVDLQQLDTPPLREYLADVVDYYKLALSASDPYIQFISFYHVMEYFYDEVFRKRLVADLRDRITSPGFSYKSDDKIYELAQFVKNRLRMNDESGQGNELESLKFVLEAYVSVEELKKRIAELDTAMIPYYQSQKVPFCNAPAIPWTDAQGVYTQLARRIYFVRNSLVHSKSGKNQQRYRPYRDEQQLQREIPLVQSVAELIIINASVIL